jgi:tetratricopeptide (TPR) repeat protein
MSRHILTAMLFLGLAAVAVGQTPPLEELAAPAPLPPGILKPAENLPTAPAPSLAELQEHLRLLRAERKSLDADATEGARHAKAAAGPTATEFMKLRLRLEELLLKLGKRAPPAPARSSSQAGSNQAPVGVVPSPAVGAKTAAKAAKEPSNKQGPAAASDVGQPAARLALAHALFEAGNYEQALEAFRSISLTGMKVDERAPLQYLTATCLRKLGKIDEAAALYREVANLRGDEQVAACAQWQLSLLRWQAELASRLRDVRQRREALENTP